jgi:hypothetical protein
MGLVTPIANVDPNVEAEAHLADICAEIRNVRLSDILTNAVDQKEGAYFVSWVTLHTLRDSHESTTPTDCKAGQGHNCKVP